MIFRSGWATGAFPLPLLIGLLMPLDAQAEHREADGMKTIEGTVWYRERMVLPPNAEIRVTLQDVARADAPSDLLSTTSFGPQGGPPFAFSLEYDPARLHDRGRYAQRARIEADGRLLFTSTEHIPAFERESGPVKILVSRVGGARVGGNPPAAKPDTSLTDTYWKLIEMGAKRPPPAPGNAS